MPPRSNWYLQLFSAYVPPAWNPSQRSTRVPSATASAMGTRCNHLARTPAAAVAKGPSGSRRNRVATVPVPSPWSRIVSRSQPLG